MATLVDDGHHTATSGDGHRPPASAPAALDIVEQPALIIGAGGSGVLTVTHILAALMSIFGRVSRVIRLLGIDVVPTPPKVTVPGRGANGIGPQAGTAQLVAGTEYLQIGKGCVPSRLSGSLRRQPDLNPELLALLDRQPGGRFTKSLETGTEGERLYGLLAFTWSRGEIRRFISSALKELNDLRPQGEGGATAAVPPMSLIVIIVASVAGGVGSAIALPLCGEVKRAMNELGMDVSDSQFIGVLFTPDCFPPTTLRSSNAYETLRDLAVAQQLGVTP